MKIANIGKEFLHIFWTTWGNSMKFSGKMCFKIILKVTKNQGSNLSIEDTFFKKPGRLGLITYLLTSMKSFKNNERIFLLHVKSSFCS